MKIRITMLLKALKYSNPTWCSAEVQFLGRVQLLTKLKSMETITKAEVARLLTQNHSAFLGAGLKKNDMSLEDYFATAKKLKLTDNRTAKCKGMRLVFSNNSVLNLNDYRNTEYDVAKFFKDGNYIILYSASKENKNRNFSYEHLIIYYIYDKE